MVAVGGYRTVNGNIMPFGHLEHTLMHLRAQNLENQEIRTRSSYISVARNYGDISLEMTAELTRATRVPSNITNYNLLAGTPLFIETMRADSVRYTALVSASSAANVITIDNAQTPFESRIHVGQVVEVNGEQRTVTNINQIGNSLELTLNANLTHHGVGPVPIGSLVLISGHDYANPHMNAVHRVTDKYGSPIIDDNRYQVDRATGRIRYRPSAGTVANSIWHPEALLNKPYYFGRAIDIRRTPPPAGPPDPPNGIGDGVPNNEGLGMPDDPVASGSNSSVPIAAPGTGAGQITNFGRTYPDGEFSNIRITAAPGVTFEVELNGAKLAIFSDPSATAPVSVTIPFFDPNFNNDQLKASQNVDPDIYIQRFLKEGANHLVIKATATQAGNNGIRVEGIFNGVNLETGPAAEQVIGRGNPKPHSAVSVIPSDWSVSQHSILGIAGKVDFDLGDRIHLEDVNDEVQKTQGVLESLTTLIAGIDVNQLNSLLSVIK